MLAKLFVGGCGLAGWRGHMGDAFRDRPTCHFLIGGQFVAHPPGWPDNATPSDDFVDYDVTVTRPGHPVMEGIRCFRRHSAQYCMRVDPSNAVLATTTFSGERLWWIEGAGIPAVWTRRRDKGRVFRCPIGHTPSDLKIPQITETIRRGARWATRPAALERAA